jgi:hypothetical protein
MSVHYGGIKCARCGFPLKVDAGSPHEDGELFITLVEWQAISLEAFCKNSQTCAERIDAMKGLT